MPGKTFTNDRDGFVSILVPGYPAIFLAPGESHETEDAGLIAALEQNPDLSSSAAKGKGNGRRKK